MFITFEAEITPDGLIKLPTKYGNLADRRVSVTITDEPNHAKANPQKAKIMKYAGIWSGMSDEDLGLSDIIERRQTFFGDREVEL